MLLFLKGLEMQRKLKLNLCITVVTVFQGFVTALNHSLVISCLLLC